MTAFKNTEFNSVCVITVSGKDAKVAIAVQGEKQFCLEQGKYLTGPRGKCFPDPRKTTVIIYNGTNHYCGVVGAGTAEKPGDEDGLSITTPKIVDDLARAPRLCAVAVDRQGVLWVRELGHEQGMAAGTGGGERAGRVVT